MDYFFYHTLTSIQFLYISNTQQSKSDDKFTAMFETEDEKFQKLLECLEPLHENQVQVDSFTLFDLHSFVHLTAGQMVKHVQVLTTIQYKDVRDSVLAKANSLGICPLSREMNLRHIYDVCQWMKTKTGIEAVVEVQRSEKLRRRAEAKGRTVAESAMIRAFNAQFAEYSSELKKARAVLEISVLVRRRKILGRCLVMVEKHRL